MSFYILLVILTIIICVVLAFFVLIQNPKGGGLDANFGGVSNNTFGAQRTTDFLEKGTWYLAIALLAVSLASGILIQHEKGSTASEGLDKVAPTSTQAPVDGSTGMQDILDTSGNDGGEQTTESTGSDQ